MEMLATEVDATSKVRPIDGSATLTIVASMIVMNIAATYTTQTATFWLTRLVMLVLPHPRSSPRRPVFFRALGGRQLVTADMGLLACGVPNG